MPSLKSSLALSLIVESVSTGPAGACAVPLAATDAVGAAVAVAAGGGLVAFGGLARFAAAAGGAAFGVAAGGLPPPAGAFCAAAVAEVRASARSRMSEGRG